MRRQAISGSKITHQPTRTTHAPQPVPSTRTLLLPKSIATLPRIEIAATRSFKKRKHFLIATTLCVFSASRFLVPGRVFPASPLFVPGGYSRSAAASTRIAESAKINRNIALIESDVSHSKQKAAPQINRNISQGSWLTSSLFTSPLPTRKGETPSVTPGFGVWFRPSGAPSPLCEEASKASISKEPADAR
jgi:hypothetical protein